MMHPSLSLGVANEAARFHHPHRRRDRHAACSCARAAKPESRGGSGYQERAFVEAGGLVSYGPNFERLFHRMAYYVDQILKGAKPTDLPVERPTKFELFINLRTAKALGLPIPTGVLSIADEVIE